MSPYPPAPGGDEENRTPDPLLARQVLSHLSYTPVCRGPWLPFSVSYPLRLSHSETPLSKTLKIEQHSRKVYNLADQDVSNNLSCYRSP